MCIRDRSVRGLDVRGEGAGCGHALALYRVPEHLVQVLVRGCRVRYALAQRPHAAGAVRHLDVWLRRLLLDLLGHRLRGRLRLGRAGRWHRGLLRLCVVDGLLLLRGLVRGRFVVRVVGALVLHVLGGGEPLAQPLLDSRGRHRCLGWRYRLDSPGFQFRCCGLRRQQLRFDPRRGEASWCGLRQRHSVPREAQRHQGLDRGLAAPCPAEAGAEPRLVDETFLLQLDDLLVRAKLPELHPPPQQEGRDRRQHPAHQPDAFHVLVGRDVGNPPDSVSGGLDGDDEQHRDDSVHPHAQQIVGRCGVERHGRDGQQPRRLPQHREGHADPGQQQVQGQQDADTRVDADREEVGEISEPLLDGQLPNGRVRTCEADSGDDHRTGDDHADEYPVCACELQRRGHSGTPPSSVCCERHPDTCVQGGVGRYGR